jgi:lipopolysaccharide transport system ATP-binding protein
MTDITIRVQNLSKCYQIYDTPRDRLKQFVVPKLCRAIPPLRRFFPTPHSPLPTYYREFWALKDVSFEIKKGETVGIIGRNGSGKSTLLQLICGTLFPTGGSVETNGRIAALLELGSGFNPEFTGRENVYLNGAVLGLSKEEIDARFDAIAAFADIGDFIEQPVKTYSSGMFVRLAFAIQANVDPEILIVDEALAVGDAYFVHRCMLRFNELQKSGTTILFVSHDANSVRNLCSRAIWLVDGNIREEGNASTVVDAYLAHLFGRQVVTADSMSAANAKEADQEGHPSLQMETSIPNIDRRLGDQRCEIIGVCLYDESMNQISSTLHDKVVILRLTIKNHLFDPGFAVAVGNIFRNSKGQVIASTNSLIEGQPIELPSKEGFITIKMKVALPRLYPGSYAFSVSVGYIEHNGETMLADRIDNAIVFDILSNREMHVMMSFPTIYEVET